MTTDAPPAAFVDAIEFFHQRLDEKAVDANGRIFTPRSYFEDERGWDSETVDDKRLGWAPADADALREHLEHQGHDRGAILATGLFYEDLTPHFRGRYVFPYFDADGRPVYAISRTADHPTDPKAGQKYTKAIKTKDYSRVDEPIYGVDTLDPGEPAIITEGIADAITAHEAEIPCLSPVTTTFKKKHRPELLDILEGRDIPRAYLVQDAEPPGIEERDCDGHETIGDVLTIQQVGEGVRGGVNTAAYLADNGVDVRIAELPRAGLAKVDLDDYLQVWAGADGLRPVLARAVPPAAHRAHDPEEAAIEAARTDQQSHDQQAHGYQLTARSPPPAGDGDTSAVFNLGIRDVTDLSGDYRGPNPLGHHGDSENYFVLIERFGIAYDHKYKMGYTPLTYLLCEAGERRDGAPNGPVADREVFIAWRYAKERGLIPSDDPIPRRALVHVAVANDYCEPEDVEDGWKLPSDAYNAALDHVSEEDEVDPGRDPLTASAVSALPLAQLETLDPATRRRAARKRGVDWPTTDEARTRLADRLMQAMHDEETVVLDAPTGLGKSYGAATTPWLDHADVTGEDPVVQYAPTRDAVDTNAQHSSKTAVSSAVLRGRDELCPLCRGDHDPVPKDSDREEPDQVITVDGRPVSEWIDEKCDEKGLPLSSVHSALVHRMDQPFAEIPCEADGTECRTRTQWDGVPRDDDGNSTVDIIHATSEFARVPSLRRDCNVVFDEQPDFTVYSPDDDGPHSQNRFRRAVTAFLRQTAEGPSTFEEYVSYLRSISDKAEPYNEHAPPHERAEKEDYDAARTAMLYEPERDWYLDHPDAHALARPLVRALWHALTEEPDASGRAKATLPYYPPRFDEDVSDSAGWNREFVTVVVDADNTIRRIRATPDFTEARSVIGLDAFPTAPLWQLNTTPDISVERVLEPDERRLWRRFERGLRVIQVGDNTLPAGKNGRYFNEQASEVFHSHLREHYGSDYRTAITASAVEPRVKQLMREGGVRDPETMHYGEEKSRDDFARERVGSVEYCIDPGDGYILDVLAELDSDACPERTDVDCSDCNGDGCHECDMTGHKRAHGRGFVGDDAEIAAAVLASVRENHVAQAAGRYARRADDPDDRALVFVRTDAMPPGFADMQVPGVTWTFGEKQRAVIEHLREQTTGTTARELADATGASKEHVRQTMQKLSADDLATVRRGGPNGANLYRWCRDSAFPTAPTATTPGVADVVPDQIANSPVWDSYTWELAIRHLGGATGPVLGAGGSGQTPPEAASDGPPPG